ncbi:MAG: hypothetical protein LBQ81_08160 [Zoogloeaceae bacterium]|nr:hypothetical protein [Zoogloeaceae bacterium]
MKAKENSIRLLWWIPADYWKVCMDASTAISQEEKQAFLQSANQYTIFVVIDGELSPFAGLVARSRADIVQNLGIRIGEGNWLHALNEAEEQAVPADMQRLLIAFKPMLASMLGQVGQGMEFVLFPNTDKQGNILFSPLDRTVFSAKLDDDVFTWRLPLGSLLPKKSDPNTKETFPGNYLYNPFTGDKLK